MVKRQEVLRVVNLKKYFPLHRGLLSSIVSRSRATVRAVDGISFSVGKEEILGFVGESGCGKSTMSRAILRLIEPTSGQIHYDGIEVTSLSRGELKKVDLCRSFLEPNHLLLWDEPMNYIDLDSREEIEEVLLLEEPTMLFVEHDRAFVERVATAVLELG